MKILPQSNPAMFAPQPAEFAAELVTGPGPVTLAVGEGQCPFGHGALAVVVLHGELTGACWACSCSWRVTGGRAVGCACVPGSHTCGEGR